MKRNLRQKFTVFSLMLMLVALASPAFGLMHAFKGLTGSAAVGDAQLDGIVTANIDDGEIAAGMDDEGFFRVYQYDEDNVAAEDGDKIIYPAWTNTIGGTAYSGTGAWLLQGVKAKPLLSSGDLSGVSEYKNAAASVTPDFDAARTHVIYLAGPATTTGVSLIFTAPTLPAGNFEAAYNLLFQQPAGNSCYVIPASANVQVPSASGNSIFLLTDTAGATDWVKATYNSLTGKWVLKVEGADLQ